MEDLLDALLDGKQIYFTGQHYISYNKNTDKGYLTCPYGCCDLDFENFEGLKRYLAKDFQRDEWKILV